MVQRTFFVSHPEVVIDPTIPVPEWPLSSRGRERMERFVARRDLVGQVTRVFSSSERKARDGAVIACNGLSVPLHIDAGLNEIDRSSTGYLPPTEHAAVGRMAFEAPEVSARGWERAIDAQRRIVGAVDRIRLVQTEGDSIVVSHGGVGLLLLCHLLKEPISRKHVMRNAGGGCYFVFSSKNNELLSSWEDIDG